MCGIAGHVRPESGADTAVIERMCRQIEHRGPDSRGIHTSGPAGIAIQRLRVIDLVTGDQPIFSEDGSVAVVLNGEIYNYRELRERLRRVGHELRTEGDTEVIVHLYEELGPRCVDHLHGMFAFALWDERRGRLLLGRDRVGKKPLFYAQQRGGLSFASELGALLADPDVPRELDHRALDRYFAYGYVPAPLSAFRAVRKLPPASTLVWEGGEARIERYWRLDYARKQERVSAEDAHEQIRDGIRAAVRRRMVADVPLGAFLSGGIDSSAVVAAMAEASPQPVKTFSIGFESETMNELEHARRVAEQFSTDHHEFVVKPDAMEIVPTLVRHYGEPFGDASALPSFYLAEMARRHVTVALNGDGGDESFAGYPRYVANSVLDRLERVPRPLRALARAAARLPSSGRIDSTVSRVRRMARVAALDQGRRYLAYVTYLDGLDRTALYTPEYRALLAEQGADADAVVLDAWAASSGPDVVDRMLDVDIQTYLPGDLLMKMDIAAMAYSLEARSPLLDHEFMQLAASLPSQLKLRGTEKKVGLRAALREWLPADLLDRPKRGFELPVAEWLRGELREIARDTLLDETARRRGVLDEAHVRRLLDRHVAGAEDNAKRLWHLLMFEWWHRDLVDRTPAAAAAGAAT